MRISPSSPRPPRFLIHIGKRAEPPWDGPLVEAVYDRDVLAQPQPEYAADQQMQ
jgi:hypothetical protein